MGSNDILIAILGLGVLGGGAFLLFTPQGKKFLDELGIADVFAEEEPEYDDPYKYLTKDTLEEFTPGSKAWKQIQKRIWEDEDDKKNKDNKKVQKHFIEAYMADAYF